MKGLAVVMFALWFTGCKTTSRVDSARQSPSAQNSDEILASLQASRARALTWLKQLGLDSDSSNLLCASGYCGSARGPCERLETVRKSKFVTAIRESILQENHQQDLRRALQRLVFRLSEESDAVRENGEAVDAVMQGDTFLGNRARLAALSPEELFELIVAKASRLALINERGPFADEGEADRALAGCLLAYARGQEKSVPQAQYLPSPRVLLREEFNSPVSSELSLTGIGLVDGWAVQNGLGNAWAAARNFRSRNFRFRAAADWTLRFAATASSVKLSYQLVNGGIDAEVIYRGASSDFLAQIADSRTTPPTVLSSLVIPAAANEDYLGEIVYEVIETNARLWFRGQKVAEVEIPIRVGGMVLYPRDARIDWLVVEAP